MVSSFGIIRYWRWPSNKQYETDRPLWPGYLSGSDGVIPVIIVTEHGEECYRMQFSGFSYYITMLEAYITLSRTRHESDSLMDRWCIEYCHCNILQCSLWRKDKSLMQLFRFSEPAGSTSANVKEAHPTCPHYDMGGPQIFRFKTSYMYHYF